MSSVLSCFPIRVCLFLVSGAMGLGMAQGQSSAAWFRQDLAPRMVVQGQELPNPWAGGLNAPQFSTVHLNDDAALDLVVFDRTNNKLSTFLADPAAKTYRYAPEYEARFPKMENWMLLADYDGDGQKDLFTHTPQGIRVFRKAGSGTNWTWTLHKPVLRSWGFNGPINLLTVATDIPALVDLDDDGDLDILTFELLGDYVEFHQNMSQERYGVPDSLEFVRNGVCWGNFIKEHCDDFQLGVDCGNSETLRDPTRGRIMHAGNSILVRDFTGNGRKDILMGHVTCPNIALLRNTGTNRVAEITSFNTRFPAQDPILFHTFPAVYSEDVTFDGINDLIAAPNVYVNEARLMDFRSSSWLYQNVGSDSLPSFALLKKNFLQDQMLDVGENASPSFFDIDGDGDLDLLVATGGERGERGYRASIWYFRNTGTTREPRYDLVTENYLNLSDNLQLSNLRLQWADFNGDGVPDLGVGGTSFLGLEYRYIPNRASRGQAVRLTATEAVSITLPREIQPGDHPYFYDASSNGLLDLVVGKVQGNIVYYQNTGTRTQPNFTLQTETFAGVDFSFTDRFVGLVVGDIDQDSRPDLLTADQSGKIRIFHGGGWGQWTKRDSVVFENPLSTFPIEARLGWFLSPTLADYNGDGKPDLIVGNNAGGVFLFENTVPVVVTSTPPSVGAETWQVEVFPNPTSGYIYVQSDRDALLEVFSLQGTPLLPRPTPIRAGQEAVLNVQGWSPGLYLVQLRSEHQALTRKIVVR